VSGLLARLAVEELEHPTVDKHSYGFLQVDRNSVLGVGVGSREQPFNFAKVALSVAQAPDEGRLGVEGDDHGPLLEVEQQLVVEL